MSKKKSKSKKTTKRQLSTPSVITACLVLILIVLIGGLFYLNQKPDNLSTGEPPITKIPLVKKIISRSIAKASTQTPPATSSAGFVTIAPTGKSVRVPIFMYHYIGLNPNPADTERDALSVAPDKFDAQMEYLSSGGYTPITLDTLYAGLEGGGLPAKPVVLTFDDGYVDFYINAFPILQKYGFHAVSFIPTGLMNQGYYLSWDQIKKMQQSGLIEFEAHSVTHADLPVLSADKAKQEIFQSKQDLQAHLGVPVNFFAYPYGASNQYDWEMVKEAGFIGAVGTWNGEFETEGTQYDWPRVRVPGGSGVDQFKQIF